MGALVSTSCLQLCHPADSQTITDLDDFLTPSQACIIPVRGAKTEDVGPTEIHIDADNKYYEVSTYPTAGAGPSGSSKALEKAEINLNDCLACSGCITSTESMLITLQSHKEVLDFIAAATHPSDHCAFENLVRTPILSISPQTLASLSAHYSATTGRSSISLRTLLRRIRSFLSSPSRGGWRVWDTTFARHISLRQTVTEFEERKAYRDKGKAPDRGPGVPAPGPLPVLASACPGWVCYAEKAQGDMLPMMSATRSPQGIMGALAKNWFGSRMAIKPDMIYHVTAMPCYDKKLEASRSDYYNSIHSTRDVDCVLTTGELDLLLSDLAFDPYQPVDNEEGEASRDIRDVGCSPWPEMLNHPGSSSGSYLGNLMSSLSERHTNPTRIITREIRGSSDNVEYSLEDTVTGEIIFKGAKCYGFRNLQNLVRKVGKETGLAKGARGGGASKLSAAIAARRRKAKTASASVASTPGTPMDSDAEAAGAVAPNREDKKLDFVEVMACPGGCVNGGGQMKPAAAQIAVANGTNGTNGTADPVAVGMDVDEEGYPRPMQDDGVEAAPAPPAVSAVSGMEEGMRWSTKEWVGKVEAIYWNGLPTPPPSPSIGPTGLVGEEKPNGHGLTSDGVQESHRFAEADRLAEEIITQAAGDDAAKRWELLNTRFRKVEGDVLQGGVTHEAVVW